MDKSKLACKQVEYFRYRKDGESAKPLIRKTEAIEKLTPPNQLNNF